MHLLKTLTLLLILFVYISCERFDSEPIVIQEEYDDWTVLQIPNGEEAHAISGSIDDVLVVSTMPKVYATIDAGESWIEVADFQGPMSGFLERNDTIFIFSSFGQSEEYHSAGLCMHFSTDKGLTWQNDTDRVYSDLRIRSKYVETENNISYKIKGNTFRLDGSATDYVGTSDIEKTIDNYTSKLDIPFEYILNNLHLDNENRLYVAASYGTVNKNGTVRSGGRNSPALVFISKNPLP